MDRPIDKVLAKLQRVKQGASGNRWVALCPAHDDAKPSLGIAVGDEDRVLLKCMAGCKTEDIVKALGLEMTDLFPVKEKPVIVNVTTYEYTHGDQLFAKKVRKDYADGGKSFYWEPSGIKSTEAPLYGEKYLKPHGGSLLIVEGEKVVDAVREKTGRQVLGTGCGASVIPSDAVLSRYLDYERIYLWADNDDSGRSHMQKIAERLIALGHRGVYIVTWKEAPTKGDAADFLEVRPTSELQVLLNEAKVFLPPPDRKRITVLSADQLLELPEERVEWLVDGMIPAGGVASIIAKPKVGKSTFARALCLAVSRGDPFLGRPVKQGVAVYVGLEERLVTVNQHFQLMGMAKGDKIFVPSNANQIDDLMAGVLQFIAEEKPALVVVDPLFGLIKAKDESAYAEVREALTPLVNAAHESSTTLVFTHHAGKSEREVIDTALGSTAISGSVDSYIYIKRRDDKARAIATRQRMGEDMEETILEMDEHGLVNLAGSVSEFEVRVVGDQICDTLSDNPDGLTEFQIQRELSVRRQTIHNALHYLTMNGKIVRDQAESASKNGKRATVFRLTKNVWVVEG